MLRGPFDFLLCYMVSRFIFWCAAIPMAVLFAAYLVGIVVMCTKELWRTREKSRKGAPKREKADPSL